MARDRVEADASDSRPSVDADSDEGVLTQICVQCGEEYYFTDTEPPDSMSCARCGGTVFRSFFTPEEDEVTDDFDDTTERDLDPDDAEGDTRPSDVIDLEYS